jgi:hypothetical protein
VQDAVALDDADLIPVLQNELDDARLTCSGLGLVLIRGKCLSRVVALAMLASAGALGCGGAGSTARDDYRLR